jgi:hypothetical protein
MAAVISFDGPNKQIIVGYDGPITNTTAAEIYSSWKEWVKAGNAQYLPAFGESVGGNELGGGVGLSGYYFVRNDLGWRLIHDEFSYEIRVAGDIYPSDPTQVWIDTTPDPYSVTFVFQRSAASMVVVGTGADAAGVAAAVWDEALGNHTTAGTTGKRLSDVKPTLWGV